ncbi:maleate cis-trans isomerase family protein [Leisingera methylohalidivorans]|uniref:Asp/Glu racemase n=1 Tax=Leisingera methylohalidivorans DSM 14336 TaxID=999552 RepID=V9W165_9RHOB|nr:Asp/Glu racemase [Leisingera methylohalidivorans]AHD03405.1 Asp/Glu racemase [Leisingera methylohalidivorans DSM 14336]
MTYETRTRAKIGVLVPFSNTNLEPDMMLMRCPDTTVHFQRMGGYDADEIPGSSQMAGLGASDIRLDLRMISGVRPDVVLYGCTSATLTHGPGFDEKLAQDIKAGSGALSFTAAGALVGAVNALGATKVGFSSPYLGEIKAQAVAFLMHNRIATVKCADAGRELGNYGQGELTPDEVFDLACQADHPEAQAIVLSCTDMRSLEAAGRIEAALGKPVVTSNQAMMFAAMRALGLPRHENVPGRLFDLL